MNKQRENKPNKIRSIYGLAEGKPGRKYTVKQFKEITKNLIERKAGYNTDRTIIMEDGFGLPIDSKQEGRLANRLIREFAIKRLRGQCLAVPYEFGGKQYTYIPDFVALTSTNKIVVIEVKELAQMNSRRNHKKYLALRKYCLERGYLFLMCDSRLNVYGREKKKTRMKTVERLILGEIKSKGEFNYQDYRVLIRGKKRDRVNAVRDAIGAFVSCHSRYKMIGDLTHDIARFKIKKKAPLPRKPKTPCQ